MNNELLTRFLHEELYFSKDVECDSFRVFEGKVMFSLKNRDGLLPFGEFFPLYRYEKWYGRMISDNREEKLNELGL